jgi:hypothetical protein
MRPRGGVVEKAPLEIRIGPGLGDHFGAVLRPDPRLESLDDGVERRRLDIAFSVRMVSSARTRSCVSEISEPRS